MLSVNSKEASLPLPVLAFLWSTKCVLVVDVLDI